MGKNIDFKKYRYFYNHGIIRMNVETKEFERFLRDKFVKTGPIVDIEDRLNDARDDLSELTENSSNELAFLKSELTRTL
jgi:hypothetical protein